MKNVVQFRFRMEYNGPPVDTMTTFVSRYNNSSYFYTAINQFKYANNSMAWVIFLYFTFSVII
jgi:hypothetical protein